MPTLHGGNIWSWKLCKQANLVFDVIFLISGHTDDSEEIEQHGVGLRFKYSS